MLGPGRAADIAARLFDPRVMERWREGTEEAVSAEMKSDPVGRFRRLLEAMESWTEDPKIDRKSSSIALGDQRPTVQAFREYSGVDDASKADRDATWEAVWRRRIQT